MLRIKELGERTRQQTLFNLREVCGERVILPDSHVIPTQPSKLTAEPDDVSRYAEVWRGQMALGEGGNGMTDVCIKVIKAERVHEVGEHLPYSARETH